MEGSGLGQKAVGLARYAHGEFRSWTARDGLSNDFVRTLAQDSQGKIWAGTDNGLLRLDGDRFVRVDGTGNVPTLAVHAICLDRNGNLWVGGSRLLRLNGSDVTEFTMRGEASQNRVKSIVQTQDGTIWVGTVSGLNRMVAGQKKFERVNGISGTVRVLRQTADGVLWIGTIGQGVFEYRAGNMTQITAPASLPSNTVLNFFEDNERNFWIGTQSGMLRLTQAQLSIVPLPKANDSDFGTIYQDRDGSFWIGSTLLFHMKDGVVAPEILPGVGSVHVRNVYRDRSGALWVGTDGDGDLPDRERPHYAFDHAGRNVKQLRSRHDAGPRREHVGSRRRGPESRFCPRVPIRAWSATKCATGSPTSAHERCLKIAMATFGSAPTVA